MAYRSKEKMEKSTGREKQPKSISDLYFEEKECRFGTARFSVLLPRKAFADLILNYPAVGVA